MKSCAIVLMVLVFFSRLNAEDLKSAGNVLPKQHAALRQELLDMMKEDQECASEILKAFGEAGITLDRKVPLSNPRVWMVAGSHGFKALNLRAQHWNRMKAIIDEYGWPGTSVAGKDGSQAAWILVQHADHDRDFQKRCLKLMEEAPNGEVERKHIAYLTDRILIGTGKKQKYGTQFGPCLVLRPIEDEDGVDGRRKEMGLQPLNEYIEMARRDYSAFSQSKLNTK